MKTHLPAARGVAGVLILSLARLVADTVPLTPTLDFTTGPAGKQARISWPAQPGARLYRVEKSTSLSPDGPGGWSPRWVVDAQGGPLVTIVDPEPESSSAFYRVPALVPEVIQVQPPVLSSGGTLLVDAQCLPAGSSLVFEIEGIAPISAPLVQSPDGRYHVILPVIAAAMSGARVITVRVVDAVGNTVTTVHQQFEITTTGLATLPPPVLPPVIAAVVKTKTKSNQSNDRWFSDGDCDDADENCDGITQRYTGDSHICTAARGTSISGFEPVTNTGALRRGKRSEAELNLNAFNKRGPAAACVVVYQRTVLTLSTPAGPPLDCRYIYTSRRYGSGAEASSQFDFSWNCRIVPVPFAAGVNAERIVLFGGNGRREVLVRQADGTYKCDGAFRSGKFNADTSFTLTFADQSKMIFCPLVGAPWQGRLGSVMDANGVAVNCTYTAAGQLNTVTSQFGQSFTCTYGSDGQLSKITDHTGREVSISRYGQGETGGSPGDVKSISCPQIPGQAPLAGPTTFTYTTGNADDALNHNLLTVRNGENQLLRQFTYSTQTNPAAIDYDTCASSDSTSNLLAGHINFHKIEWKVPGDSAKGYRVITGDAEGRVTECDFDASHRATACRCYTGYATPGIPVTSTTNRPDPLTRRRSTDPAYYETTWLYNGQHLCTRETAPDGTQHRFTHECDLNPSCPVRESANARVYTLRSPAGEERTITCTYLSGFGTPEGVWAGEDGEGGCTDEMDNIGSSGQENGGTSLKGGERSVSTRYWDEVTPQWSTAGTDAFKSSDDMWSFSGGPGTGTLAGGGGGLGGVPDPVFSSNPIPGIGVVIKHNPPSKPHKRVIGGGTGVWPGEDGDGGCTESARGTNPDGTDCTNKGRPKLGSAMLAASHVIPIGCGGGTGIAGCLRPGNPIKGISVKGGRNPTRLTTSLGQVFVWTYDPAGNCLTMRTPVTGAGCNATYNVHGQCTSLTVLNGPGSSFTQQCTFNPATGWLSSHVMDPAGLHITTTFEGNALGQVTRCVDPLGYDWLTDYNALDCVTRTRSPVVGVAPTASRIACDYFYNRAGQCARVDLEHRDPAGALVTTNPAYSSFIVRNDRGLVVRVATEQHPVDVPAVPPLLDPAPLGIANFATTDFTYNDAGECVRVSTPAACRGQTEDAVCDYLFDERRNLWRTVSGGLGALTTVTTQIDYDTAGAVTAVSLLPSSSAGVPGDPLTSTFTWDGYHRLRTCRCPLGNVYVYDYDPNGGVTCSLYGEVNDVPGSAGNVLLSRGSCTVTPARLVFTAGNYGAAQREVCFDKWIEELARRHVMFRFSPGEPEPHAADVTIEQFSPAGLRMSVSRNGDTLVTNSYDSAGRWVGCNASATCQWDTTLDSCGRVISTTRTDLSSTAGAPSESFTTTCTRDPLGRVIGTTDGSGNTVSISSDSCDRITQCTNPNGVIYRFHRDVKHSDGKTYTILLQADTDGDGQYETLRRCTCDNGYYVSCTSANGYTRTTTLDPLNRTVGINYPDGTHEAWFADSYGRLAMCLHRDGTMAVTDFDRDGRPDLVSYFGGPGALPTDPIDYNCDGRGLVTGVSQGTSMMACTYDSVGNQLSEKHNGYGVTRTFNDRGRTGITCSDGTRFIEARDRFGNIVSVSAVSSTGVVLSPPVSTVVRLGFRPASETRAGVTTTWDYRSNGEAPLPGGTDDYSFDTCVRTVCTNAQGNTFHSTRVRRDHAQNVTQTDVFFAGAAQSTGRRHLQSFDRLGCLTSSTIQRREVAGGPFVTESSVTYTVDLEGRRLTATGGSYPGVYTQNDASPPADRQMGQYSSWPGGGPGGSPLTWDDQSCLTSMSSSSGQKQFVYNTLSQLVAVNNLATGEMIASYAYNARGQRTRSTVAGSTAAQPPVTTYFIYDGDRIVQELGEDGHPNITMAGSEIGGIALCVISRNGSTVYPHGGGGGSTDFVYPILPADLCPLEEIPIDDDIWLDVCRKAGGGGGGSGGCGGSPTAILGFACTAGPAGNLIDRLDATHSGEPIFLTSDGLPRPGATGTLAGFDWFARGSGCSLIWSPRSNILLYGRYCPETGFLQCGECVYSPQLGTDVSTQKTKPKKDKDKGTDSPVHGGWDVATNKKV